MIDLSIAIASYNTRDLLRQCLRSIVDNTDGISYEIIVVDNASQDGSAEMIAGEFPNVILLRNRENLFFARANNQARDLARGDYICLLNSDTMLPRGSLKFLVEKIRQDRLIGAIGCKMLSASGEVQESIYRRVSLANLLSLSKYLSRIARHLLPTRHYSADRYELEGVVEVLQDSLLIMPLSLMRNREIYDPNLKLYSTEDQIAEELRRAGLKLLYTPAVCATHLLSQSTKPAKHPAVVYAIARDDAYQFFRRYRGAGQARFASALLTLDLVLIRAAQPLRAMMSRTRARAYPARGC